MTRMTSLVESLERDVAKAQPTFERQHGKLAAALLPHLTATFHMLRRVPFDLEVPQRVRHKAAAAALYILEVDDFLASSSAEASALVDDVWIAAAALHSIASDLDDDNVLAKHWRSSTPLPEVLGLAHNCASLEQHVPKRVLDSVKAFLNEA